MSALSGKPLNFLQHQLRIEKAKPAKQRTRNWALNTAKEKLSALDPNAHVEVKWLIEGSKDRTVEINGATAFTQKPTDSHGAFAVGFADVSLE